MNKKNIISFSLSQEELLVVLSYLHVKELLGLNIGDMADLSKDQIRSDLGVAERALIARGILIPGGDNRFKLAKLIHAVMGTVAAQMGIRPTLFAWQQTGSHSSP